MIASAAVDPLSMALIAAASDPARLDVLYKLLGEFCHVFRNRLNCLKLSLYLASRAGPLPDGGGWSELERRYRDAERIIERFHAICRPAPVVLVRLPFKMFLDDRLPVWADWLSVRARRLELVEPQSPAIGHFDPTRLAQGLDALAAWRSEAGAPETIIRLRWRVDRGQMQVDWEEPLSVSGVEEPPGDRSRSLALPLVARVMTDHGGTMTLETGGGLCLRLCWPQAARPA